MSEKRKPEEPSSQAKNESSIGVVITRAMIDEVGRRREVDFEETYELGKKMSDLGEEMELLDEGTDDEETNYDKIIKKHGIEQADKTPLLSALSWNWIGSYRQGLEILEDYPNEHPVKRAYEELSENVKKIV
jgi:hypothetical protein